MDVIVALLQRDRIDEALDLQLEAMMFAMEYDLETEDAMRMRVDDMVAKSTSPQPQQAPYIPQVLGWDRVYYGPAAFKEDEE